MPQEDIRSTCVDVRKPQDRKCCWGKAIGRNDREKLVCVSDTVYFIYSSINCYFNDVYCCSGLVDCDESFSTALYSSIQCYREHIYKTKWM